MKAVATPNILFEDNHVIVAVKQPGILSQPGEKNLPDMLTLLKAYLKEKYQKPGNVFLGLVHRLDLNAGGVMVFAKTSKAAKRLFESITHHEFRKEYAAIVEGVWTISKEGRFEDNLLKDENLKISQIAEESTGQKAVLNYRVACEFVENFIPCTGVLIELETGRFHQIRKQFSHRGHPLWGDTKYGAISKASEIALWAYQITFPHPISAEPMTFHDLPKSPIFGSLAKLIIK